MNSVSRNRVFVLVAASFFNACAPTPQAATTMPDGGADAASWDATSANGTLRVRVFDGSGGKSDGPILVGAQVALDKPNGERVEVRTDSSGIASFDGIDWSLGPGRVTAYAEGYSLRTQLDVSGKDVGISLSSRTARSPSVTVSGSIASSRSPNDVFNISSTAGGSYEGGGVQYSLQAAKGAPFTLIAIEHFPWGPSGSSRGVAEEYFNWSRFDVPAASSNVQVNVDFAKSSLTPKKTTAILQITGGLSGHFGTSSNARIGVSTIESGDNLDLGGTLFSDITPDGTAFNITGSYVTLDGLSDHLLTTYTIGGLGQSYELSAVSVEGEPSNGAVIGGFLDPQEFTPAPTLLGTPMRLTPATDGTTSIGVVIVDATKGESLWIVDMPAAEETVIFPALPFGLGVDDVFTKGTLFAFVFSTHFNGDGRRDKLVGSRAIELPRP